MTNDYVDTHYCIFYKNACKKLRSDFDIPLCSVVVPVTVLIAMGIDTEVDEKGSLSELVGEADEEGNL